MQIVKRFLNLFSKIRSRNQNALSKITKKITLKELTPRPFFFCNSNASAISRFMQNIKRFLKLFSKIRSRDQNCFSRLQREITIKELTPGPLFLSNRTILSIPMFMQNMKRFLKLFNTIKRIRSRNQKSFSRITKGNNSKGIDR